MCLKENAIIGNANAKEDDSPLGMAVAELKKACTCAKRFDELFMNEPVIIPYDSPYFDMLSFDSKGLLVYGPLDKNKRTDDFKWWLSGECFAMLREQSDFKELYSD